MVTYDQFAGRCEAVLGRIRQACLAAGRAPDSVRLLPVTKTHPVDAALFAHRFGLPAVGENRVQEALQKRPQAPAICAVLCAALWTKARVSPISNPSW